MKTYLSRIFFIAIILSLFFSCSQKTHPLFKAQQQLHYSLAWEQLNTYPVKRGRSDDLYFFNPERGFVINSQGYLLLTEDGGDTWENKFRKDRTFFRCLTFKDSLTGFLGTIGPGDSALRSADSIAMYETFDGGESWKPTKFNGPYPKGLCGLQTVSDKVIVGCGRVRGPSYFIRTEDGGKNWNSYDLNHLAGSLIAPYFYDEQHGILVGGTTTDKVKCQSLVLETFDGGASWDTIYVSRQKGEYCWKVVFPTANNGFISIQRNVKAGQVYVLQTKDGGKTWFENHYFDKPDYVQGIGFVNEKVGWMGGSNKWTMETRDGGETWRPMADIGRGFNKFQFFGDSLGYGVGFGVYKMRYLRPVLNGWVEDRYDNKRLKSKLFYKNGIQSGKAIYYHENGKVKRRGRMHQNLRRGQWKFYHENGRLSKKIKYKNGLASIDKKSLKDFVGKYEIEADVFRTITYKDGKLYSQHSQSNEIIELLPISDKEFLLSTNRNATIEFVREMNGVVVRHIMKSAGHEREAIRIQNK